MDDTATSISPWWMISSIGVRCTSTSHIDFSTCSGSMPMLIVRFAWGSRAPRSPPSPCSLSAAPRFTVDVVLATPPFWLARAITSAPRGEAAATRSRRGADDARPRRRGGGGARGGGGGRGGGGAAGERGWGGGCFRDTNDESFTGKVRG